MGVEGGVGSAASSEELDGGVGRSMVWTGLVCRRAKVDGASRAEETW